MAVNDESDQLQQCPRCLYSLKGLPTEHKCPECGLLIDRRWQVFGGKLIPTRTLRSTRINLAIPLILMFLVFALWLVQIALRATSVVAWISLLSWGTGILILGWLLCTKPKKFVAIGPRGVFIYHGTTRCESYIWNRVGKASYNLLRKTIDIEMNGGRVRLRAYEFFRVSVREAEQCIRRMNAFPRPSGDES